MVLGFSIEEIILILCFILTAFNIIKSINKLMNKMNDESIIEGMDTRKMDQVKKELIKLEKMKQNLMEEFMRTKNRGKKKMMQKRIQMIDQEIKRLQMIEKEMIEKDRIEKDRIEKDRIEKDRIEKEMMKNKLNNNLEELSNEPQPIPEPEPANINTVSQYTGVARRSGEYNNKIFNKLEDQTNRLLMKDYGENYIEILDRFDYLLSLKMLDNTLSVDFDNEKQMLSKIEKINKYGDAKKFIEEMKDIVSLEMPNNGM
jgi:hypothetical protein